MVTTRSTPVKKSPTKRKTPTRTSTRSRTSTSPKPKTNNNKTTSKTKLNTTKEPSRTSPRKMKFLRFSSFKGMQGKGHNGPHYKAGLYGGYYTGHMGMKNAPKSAC
eukprot:CAMPEP_0178939544 /NCGR_PEP_ID=MMETSP0789-20121207/275_1 /TAXON_ID=3005 /ORGANISM="Rhizosolenia setigera, Strain CCMP 1694" /LENGTH=105 /DNA_ID=CAMNT_0020618409 /DNA_START=75 /DNA_END=392 /DNA_ORIENTATION=-